MKCGDRAAARLLRDSFLDALDVDGHEKLRAHLATCEACRAQYDRQAALKRVMQKEAGPLPSSHLDRVGRAVVARAGASPAASGRRRAPWLWAFSGLAAVSAAALLLVVRPPASQFQARSGPSRSAEGIRAFCIRGEGDTARIVGTVDVAGGAVLRCARADALQLTYSTDRLAYHLAVVSLPEGGPGALSYTADGATMPVPAGAVDEPLPHSTRLSARHAPGRRVLFALFFEHPKDAAQVGSVASELAAGGKGPSDLKVVRTATLVVE